MQFSMSLLVVVGVTILLLVVVDAAPIPVAWVSDIHLDQMYGTPEAFGPCTTNSSSPWGGFGCDTPDTLLKSLMYDVAGQNHSYMFVSGDLLRHNMYLFPTFRSTAAFSEVFTAFTEFQGNGRFPLPNVDFAMGNNDFVPDWEFNVSEAEHALLRNVTDLLVLDDLLDPVNAYNFSRCAYYTRDVGDRLRVIVLNTIVYTYNVVPLINETGMTDPCGQFAYLQWRLQEARSLQRRVILMSHVGPVANIKSIDPITGLNASDMYWKPTFQETYLDLIALFKDVIAAQLFGHMHMFTIYADEDLGMPIFLLPGVSQKGYNSVSYLSVLVDDTTWAIEALTQRTMVPSLGQWQYQTQMSDLITAAGLSTGPGPVNFANVTLLAAAVRSLFTNQAAWQIFKEFYGGGNGVNTLPEECDEVGSVCRAWVVCGMLHLRHESIASCAADSLALGDVASVSPIVKALSIGLPVFVFVVVSLAVVVRYRASANRRRVQSLVEETATFVGEATA